jgi:N6-L-threonylcarbamoyladenine synthase
VHVPAWRSYEVVGRTRDDAAGEAFDKVAKLLGLGFPGGPPIEREARAGDPEAIPFPRPMMGREERDFSFSGLKTSVLRWVEKAEPAERIARRADVCASFQGAVVDVLVEKTARAAEELAVPTAIVAGGVACNDALREAMRARLEGIDVVWPTPILCTDNGAMIARTALLRADEAVRPGAFDIHASLPLP